MPGEAAVIHPIILASEWKPVIGACHDALERVLRDCELWWEASGHFIYHACVKVPLPGALPFDFSSDNPWPAVLSFLNEKAWYPAEHLKLVFLSGWNPRGVIGWGGPNLALVGDWAINKLSSIGSPEAIVDDSWAGAVILHEVGHALGYAHDFDTPHSVMGYHWDEGWDVLPPSSASPALLEVKPCLLT